MFWEIISVLSLLYIWWIYWLIISRPTPRYDRNYTAPVSVIIPCYNEDYKQLKQCIDSIIKANGKKQIILVNNNSNKKETIRAVDEYRTNKEVLVLDEQRQGKRFAHSKGLSQAKHEIIVFVDSDTTLHKNALLELVIPFQDNKIGGVTGQMLLANKNRNLITKGINAMFWSSCNLFRRASTSAGFMQVMPGAISSYRKEDLLKLEKDYLNQTFLGRPCTISDDRYLTMRLQTKFGKKIQYVDRAMAFTYMPQTLIGFWKTMERWRRGMIREVLLLWKQSNRKSKLLFFDTQFNFVMFNIMMIPRILLVYYLIFAFSLSHILIILGWLLLMNAFYGAYFLINNPREFPYKILYSFFYEFFWSFTYFQALINIRNQGKWVTR